MVCLAIARCHTNTEMFGIPEMRAGGLASFTDRPVRHCVIGWLVDGHVP